MACLTFHAPCAEEFLNTRSKVWGAFHGLRPNPTGSALPFSCFRRPHDDTASFTSCCGPPNCSAPLRTRHFGRPRGLHYRGPWRLPGPDLHRLVVVNLSLGYVMVAPLHSWRPELLDARGFRGIPLPFGQSSGHSLGGYVSHRSFGGSPDGLPPTQRLMDPQP